MAYCCSTGTTAKAKGQLQMIGEKGASSSLGMNGGVIMIVSINVVGRGAVGNGTGGCDDLPGCIIIVTSIGAMTGWCSGEGGRVIVIVGIGSCSMEQKIAMNWSQ